MAAPPYVSVLEQMRLAWDQKAEEEALWHSCPRQKDWSVETFLASGAADVATLVAPRRPAIAGTGQDAPRRILDYGCGAGRTLQALRGLADEAVGVDISPRMLARAKEIVGNQPGIRFVQGDGMTLECVRRLSFDLALAFDVLPHLPDLGLVRYTVRHLGRQLLPGGRLFAHFDTPRLSEPAIGEILRAADLEPETVLAQGPWLWVVAARRTAG